MARTSGDAPTDRADSDPAGSDPADADRRRLRARIALGCFAAALAVVVGAIGLTGVELLLVWLAAYSVILAGAYLFLARRGTMRWTGAALVVLAAVGAVWFFATRGVFVVAVIAAVILAVGLTAARSALRHPKPRWLREYHVAPAERPFFLMNPRSGDGKVERFHLKERAEALGAQVRLLDGPGHVDVTALARDAVEGGADLLGVAGGDGTQALVAAVAAEHDLPFVVLSAGTRNHFALDLGLDRSDPATGLDALTDGIEVRVDLGDVAGRPFVNNASFRAYAEIVSQEEYREDKTGTILAMLPDLLEPSAESLTVELEGRVLVDRQVALVSNNPYGSGRLTDVGRRYRLDRAVLGIITGTVDSALSAVQLQDATRRPIEMLTAREVTVSAPRGEIPVGVDGEAVTLPSPVRCVIRPEALRVRLPRLRPGVPQPPPVLHWDKLWRIAFPGSSAAD